MRAPRGLSAEEAALWRRVAATVKPLNPPRHGEEEGSRPQGSGEAPAEIATPQARALPRPPLRPRPAAGGAPPRAGEDQGGLDSSWDRKLARGLVAPDFTLDLHGLSLAQAHARLDAGLAQAKALDARLVLLIAGKPRGAAAADRGEQRGVIRAKALDWLAAGPHAGDIAAVRKAHRRHGGEGALYLVLRKRR